MKNIIKIKILPLMAIGAALVAALAIGAGSPERKHSVVILRGVPAFHRLNDHQYNWDGITVFCSSSSSNAPTYTPATFESDGTINGSESLAEAIASLLDQGYRIERRDSDSGSITVWLIRNR